MDLESDLSKDNFLARMSHEMRTPLNAILGMCTLAQTMNTNEKVADCLEKINEASLHLLGLINSVLDLAKIETGNLKLINEEVELGSIFRKAAETVTFTTKAKGLNLVLDLDTNLPELVLVDEKRLGQILDTLLSNAVKFTPPAGTVTLSVKKLAEDEKTCTLEIRVSDTGIGISEEAKENIFKAFEQLDGGMARKYGGAGIGLPIALHIVRLMGGELHLDSQPGKGTTFHFEIKLERVKGETASEQTDGALDFSGKAILIAEDVEINREIVLSILEDFDLIADCAENGLEALEQYKNNPKKYSLIFMDIHMPEMDGYEATRQIRAFELEQNISPVPIIAMTANVFKEDVQKCLDAGMTGHMGKPIDFAELLKHLSTYVASS